MLGLRLMPFLFCLLTPTFSKAEEGNSPWKSEVEFGFQRLTGNSDSLILNARLGVDYTEGPYRHLSEGRFLLIEKDGMEDKRKSQFESQANYKYSQKYYVLGNISYAEDRYGPYFNDFTLATGLGYQAIWREDLSLLLEFGPGYRSQIPNLEEIDQGDLILPHNVQELIFRGQSVLEWKLKEGLFFEGRITIIGGVSNTSFESRLALITNIIDPLAINLSTTQKYINVIPPGLKNLDSVFSITIVYRF